MRKTFIQNLCLITTEYCNLNCAHCERGKCTNKFMSYDVIKAVFDQCCGVASLNLCGGEITYSVDTIEKIISYIVDNKKIITGFAFVINGTRYSNELLRLTNYLDQYIKKGLKKKGVICFAVSYDKYHLSEIERLNLIKEYIENVNKYKESKYFDGYRTIDGKLYKQGNAENLSDDLTVPLKPIDLIMTYVGRFNRFNQEDGILNVGPFITVNVDGIVTECDASIEKQRTEFNYGNILTDSIEDICIKRNALVLKPNNFLKEQDRIIKNYYK